MHQTQAVLSCALPAPFEDAYQPLAPARPIRSPAGLEAGARCRQWVGGGAEPEKLSPQHVMTWARGPYQTQLEQVPAMPCNGLREHTHDARLFTRHRRGKEEAGHPVVQFVPRAADEPEDALSRVGPVFGAKHQRCQRHELAALLGNQEGQRPSQVGLVVWPYPFQPLELIEEPSIAGREHHYVVAWSERTQLIDRGHPVCLNAHSRRRARSVRPRTTSFRIQRRTETFLRAAESV